MSQMRNMILEFLAAGLVIAGLVAVPIATFWYDDYSFRSKYGPDARIFKLTAVAKQGRVTRGRVGGYNYWSGKFPRLDTIAVNKGEKVVLVVKSADVTHSFRINPALDVEQPVEMEGGHTKVIAFKAETPGTYFAECRSFCGNPHHAMFFTIKIRDPSKL